MSGAHTSTWIRAAIGYAAAGALLWWFLRGTEWQSLADGLRSVRWPLLAAAIALRIGVVVLSAFRWQLLLAPVRSVPIRPLLVVTMMGMAVTAVAPVQAAEVARPYLLSRRREISFTAAVGTIVVEWAFDAFGVLAVFIPAAVAFSAPTADATSTLDRSLLLFVLVAVNGIALITALPRWSAKAAGWTRRSSAFSPMLRERIAGHCASFGEGLRIVEQPVASLTAAGYSVAIAGLTAFNAWLVLSAFGLPIPLIGGFLLLGLITVAGLVPTPGGVGSFHAICQLGLVALFHIDRSMTVAPVIALHAALYLPPAAIGAVCFIPFALERRTSEITS